MREFKELNPQIACKDGATLSVQASRTHYSSPRADRGPYDLVEVGFPSVKPIGKLVDYAENPDDLTGTAYGYVPVDAVMEYINAHGGIESGCLPT